MVSIIQLQQRNFLPRSKQQSKISQAEYQTTMVILLAVAKIFPSDNLGITEEYGTGLFSYVRQSTKTLSRTTNNPQCFRY